MITRALKYGSTVVVMLSIIRPIIELIKEMEIVFNGEKQGQDRKDAIMQSMRAIFEGLNEFSKINLPVDVMLSITSTLVEVLFVILKRRGELEPEDDGEWLNGADGLEITKS